jgi:hypothetical protein
MKKELLRMAVAMLAIMVAISGLGIAVAQEGQDGAEVPVLAVDVPNVVQVDESVTITVTERSSGIAVEGASVYALSWPKLGLSDTNSIIAPQGYSCEFLGRTTGGGNITHAFDRVGGLLIVATKEGYGPGLAWLTVKPNLLGRLAIDAPGRAKVDEFVSIKVFEKNSVEAVGRADVWAISLPLWLSPREMIPSAADAKALLEELRGASVGDVTEILDGHGQYLGQTNDAGELKHAFGEVGMYMLISTKSGYVPGVKAITIVADEALAIKADPRRADVGEDITFTATTRGTGTPVDDVALYALSMGSIGRIPMPLPQTDVQNFSFSEMVVESGEYLGATNEFGELKHQFSEAGIYLIVGIEDGYVPGITFVFVGQFDGLRQVLPRFSQFGEGLGLKGLLPQLKQFGEGLGLKELLPQLKQFGEGLGLKELSPQLNQLRERFHGGLWQFGRGS